ncbi:P-loop NTPase [Microbacterium sp. BWT-B31]|uniref:AAA family ATPase n=1 Tax=Microbacterium sp. BWT-B31 TaxID=3232072 RepID=UPI00352985A9
MRVLVAVDAPWQERFASGLAREGIEVIGVVAAASLAAVSREPAAYGYAQADAAPDAEQPHSPGFPDAAAMGALLGQIEVVVLEAARQTLTADVVALCDRHGVRIAPLSAASGDERIAAAFGLPPALPVDVEPWRLAETLRAPTVLAAGASAADARQAPPGAPRADPAVADPVAEASPAARAAAPHPVAPDVPAGPRTIAVWGTAGAPGRSTIAIELAVELARGGRHVGLVDADAHAPSIALTLGLADEGPGFAAACRQVEVGGLDARELTRISLPIGTSGVDVLTGINRPSRWPELSDSRVTGALAACRVWADHTVVDVAASLEQDEEIVSDLSGPRRNAATLAALRAADLVVATVAADPVGVSRFLRAYPELRATIGATPVVVLANRLRPGTLGIDARGQVRRTLDRFGGIESVWFVPADPRSVDAALLAARPIAEVAPRSPFTLALRRFVGEAIVPPLAAPPRRRPPRRGAPREGSLQDRTAAVR